MYCFINFIFSTKRCIHYKLPCCRQVIKKDFHLTYDISSVTLKIHLCVNEMAKKIPRKWNHFLEETPLTLSKLFWCYCFLHVSRTSCINPIHKVLAISISVSPNNSRRLFYCLYTLGKFKHIFPMKLKGRRIETLVFPHFDFYGGFVCQACKSGKQISAGS